MLTPSANGPKWRKAKKSTNVKHFRSLPPPSARQEKWREGVWRSRKTQVFDIFGLHLAERGLRVVRGSSPYRRLAD